MAISPDSSSGTPISVTPVLTYLENLEAAKTNIAAVINEITENPKPSYSIDGQTVQWAAYLRMLLDKLRTLDEEIKAADTSANSANTEIHSIGVT